MLGINQDLQRLEAQGKRVKIGLVGVGQMGTDIVSQVAMMQGIEVVAAADIEISRVSKAFRIAGLSDSGIAIVDNLEAGESALAEGRVVLTTAYRIITDLSPIEVVIEATGSPEVGAQAGLRTLFRRKHLVMMNVETDVTIGSIMKLYADRCGVVYTLAAGDEPAAVQELYDFADALGLSVVAVGKGKNNPLDRSATPQQLKREAARRGLTPSMLVEFVDGTKTMIEMAAVSNATGLIPDVRGMHGPHTSVSELRSIFALKEEGGILNQEGVVDYVIGDVAPGVFLIFKTNQPRLKECLVLRDMGCGPNYLLLRPYHLCSMEVPLSAARAVIQQRPTMAPQRCPVAEVMTVAKIDMPSGIVLESIGGATHYGMIDKADIAAQEHALPIGLAKGAKVLRDIKQGEEICYEDVELPEGSTVIALRRLQDAWTSGELDENETFTRVDTMIRSHIGTS